jgi:hypothetical protein
MLRSFVEQYVTRARHRQLVYTGATSSSSQLMIIGMPTRVVRRLSRDLRRTPSNSPVVLLARPSTVEFFLARSLIGHFHDCGVSILVATTSYPDQRRNRY